MPRFASITLSQICLLLASTIFVGCNGSSETKMPITAKSFPSLKVLSLSVAGRDGLGSNLATLNLKEPTKVELNCSIDPSQELGACIVRVIRTEKGQTITYQSAAGAFDGGPTEYSLQVEIPPLVEATGTGFQLEIICGETRVTQVPVSIVP